jgi:hypothetical protein
MGRHGALSLALISDGGGAVVPMVLVPNEAAAWAALFAKRGRATTPLARDGIARTERSRRVAARDESHACLSIRPQRESVAKTLKSRITQEDVARVCGVIRN